MMRYDVTNFTTMVKIAKSDFMLRFKFYKTLSLKFI